MATLEGISLKSPDLYTVAWFAALPHERAAASILLDEKHNPPKGFEQHPSDRNNYSWGCMSGHNIVIASLPAGRYGLLPAADAAGDLRASLPRIRMALFVGIGAGITGETPVAGEDSDKIVIKRDIRLGDVCVSQPDRTNGGVVQYDLTKRKVLDGEDAWELKGQLDAPPQAVLNALSALKAKHFEQKPSIVKFLEAFDRNEMTQEFKYPGPPHTQQFEPSHDAAEAVKDSGETDENPVDPLRQLISDGKVRRQDRRRLKNRIEPEIHYGTIASGNMLLKNKNERDSIVSWLQQNHVDPICFEMEAAGLMNSLPSLIIRGICDYADENKGDAWQLYAAATAAAFGKEFLETLSIREVNEIPPIKEVLRAIKQSHRAMKQMSQQVDTVHSNTAHLPEEVAKASFVALLNWLTPNDHSSVYDDKLSGRMKGSGKWFLNHPKFQKWAAGELRVLCCPGVPGAGKSFMATGAINHLQDPPCGDPTAVLYFYFDHALKSQQTEEGFLATMLRQALDVHGSATESLMALQIKHKKNKTRLSKRELTDSLFEVLCLLPTARVVIDALDEADPALRARLLSLMNMRVDRPQISWLLTTRDSIETRSALPGCEELKIITSGEDIAEYCRIEAKEHQPTVPISEDLLSNIVRTVQKHADGVFLLVRLHVGNIFSRTTVTKIRTALKELPNDREGAYKDTMTRIISQDLERRTIALSALAWVSLMEEELDIRALQHALAVSPGDTALNLEDAPSTNLIMSVCKGLLTLEPNKDNYESPQVRFSHFTTQEYIRETRDDWFPDCRPKFALACVTYTCFPDVVASRQEDSGKYALARHAANFTQLAYRLKLSATKEMRDGPPYPISFDIAALLVRAFPETGQQYRYEGLGSGWPKTKWHILAVWGLIEVMLDRVAPDRSGMLNDYADKAGQTALHYAVAMQHTSMVSLLLQRGANPNVRDVLGVSPLHLAAETGQDTVLGELLQAGSDFDAQDCIFHQTPLHDAASNGHTASMAKLLKAGATIDVFDINESTPLEVAISKGQVDAVSLLLPLRKHGSNTSTPGDFDLFCLAVEHCQVHVSHLLARSLDLSTWAGDDPHRRPGLLSIPGGTAALRLAFDHEYNFCAKNKNHITSPEKMRSACWIPAIRLLWRYPGTDVSSEYEDGLFFLTQACGLGLDDLVADILNTSAININDGLVLPLGLACRYGHESVVERLLQVANLDVNRCINGYGAALTAACDLGHMGILDRLLKVAGVDVNLGTITPLSFACRKGHLDVVERLLQEATIDVNLGMTSPLSHACKYGHLEVVERLLQESAINVNLGTRTPLSYAYEQGDLEVVDFTGQAMTIDVNLWAKTPLSYACEYGHEDIVERLLQVENIDVLCGPTEGPLFFAASEGRATILRRLLDHLNMRNDLSDALPAIILGLNLPDTQYLRRSSPSRACIVELLSEVLGYGASNVCLEDQADSMKFSYALTNLAIDVRIIRQRTGTMRDLLRQFRRRDKKSADNHPIALRDVRNESSLCYRIDVIAEESDMLPMTVLGVGSYLPEDKDADEVTHTRRQAKAHVLCMVTGAAGFCPDDLIVTMGSINRGLYPDELYEDLKSVVASMCPTSEMLANRMRSSYESCVSLARSNLEKHVKRDEFPWEPACAAATLELLAPDIIGNPTSMIGTLSLKQYWKLLQYRLQFVQCETCGEGDSSWSEIKFKLLYHCHLCPSETGPFGYDLCGQCVAAGLWCMDQNHEMQQYQAQGAKLLGPKSYQPDVSLRSHC